jgi:hypothetical protein
MKAVKSMTVTENLCRLLLLAWRRSLPWSRRGIQRGVECRPEQTPESKRIRSGHNL